MMANLIDRLASVFIKPKAEAPLVTEASIPQGTRVYAVGDVHGRADLLEQAFANIEAHEALLQVEETITVLLGDYVDRGLQSKQVLDLLIDQSHRRQIIAVCGNHDDYMLRSLTEPEVAVKWLAAGGRETLYSYDVITPTSTDIDTVKTVMAEAGERIPESHKALLQSLWLYATIGDYAFVHAGVRPGVPMDKQFFSDLTSIRQPFLDYQGPHDYVVVHGHSPVSAPEFRSNRINIDTGAYITGKLTCLVLEGTEQYIL